MIDGALVRQVTLNSLPGDFRSLSQIKHNKMVAMVYSTNSIETCCTIMFHGMMESLTTCFGKWMRLFNVKRPFGPGATVSNEWGHLSPAGAHQGEDQAMMEPALLAELRARDIDICADCCDWRMEGFSPAPGLVAAIVTERRKCHTDFAPSSPHLACSIKAP